MGYWSNIISQLYNFKYIYVSGWVIDMLYIRAFVALYYSCCNEHITGVQWFKRTFSIERILLMFRKINKSSLSKIKKPLKEWYDICHKCLRPLADPRESDKNHSHLFGDIFHPMLQLKESFICISSFRVW